MKRVLVIVLLLVWAGGAQSQSPLKVRKQVEASMLVNGEIEVDADGRVTGYEIERREKLPEGVARFLDERIAGWSFEPTVFEGRPVAIHNRMGLLLVAKRLEDGNFRMEVRSTSFYPLKQAGYELESVDMTPPSYPSIAAQHGVSGTVYLVLKIDGNGQVEEAVAEQVNLRVAASEVEMNRWRGVLAKNAISKAQQWSFRPPQHGELADDGVWTVRVPVAYRLDEPGPEPYGRWQAYIPGPRQRATWVDGDDVAPDALAEGGLYPVGGQGGLRLRPEHTGG